MNVLDVIQGKVRDLLVLVDDRGAVEIRVMPKSTKLAYVGNHSLLRKELADLLVARIQAKLQFEKDDPKKHPITFVCKGCDYILYKWINYIQGKTGCTIKEEFGTMFYFYEKNDEQKTE